MVSTATAKPGRKAMRFRELLGFDMGTATHSMRNVEDIFLKDISMKKLESILETMGPEGLIYVQTADKSHEIYSKLRIRFKIGYADGKSKKDIDRFENGEIDYLVGTSHYYGTLIRGLDIPERIKYVIFLKAPVFRVRFQGVDTLKTGMIRALALIFRDDRKISKFLPYLNRFSGDQIDKLKEILREKLKAGDFDGRNITEERIVKASGKAYELYKSVWVKKDLPEGVFRVRAKILKIPEVPLLNQAELISMMKTRGIGRPSTYSAIVDKLFVRNYVTEKNGKLIPTPTGRGVFEYLTSNFCEFVSEERTRFIQNKMDEIETGNADYTETLKDLYQEIRRIL